MDRAQIREILRTNCPSLPEDRLDEVAEKVEKRLSKFREELDQIPLTAEELELLQDIFKLDE